MKFKIILFLFFTIVFISAFKQLAKTGKIKGYDLGKPDVFLILPDTLREISDITTLDNKTVACVQDENGIIFIYDIDKNEIKKQIPFTINGDYEGIAKVGKNMYVLRSDGVLFEIENYDSKDIKLITYKTNIPAANNEGLCYDKDYNRLLIGCKGKIAKGIAFKDSRLIYAFDLKTKQLIEQPVFNFSIQTIKQFALDNVIALPIKNKKNGKQTETILHFTTSAIAIHPITKKLFLISSTDHMLFVFNLDGALEQMQSLDNVLFNKPEGISFLENGTMLISNEGQKKKPTVLIFSYNK